MSVKRTKWIWATAALMLVVGVGAASAQDKPNIVVIWGDDIGTMEHQCTIHSRHDGLQDAEHRSHCSEEGISFTDYYGRAILHRGSRGVPHGGRTFPYARA